MRILVTAGPTREFFDSVRFISNPSSGKLGYAIAAAARDRGHSVVLISGPVEQTPSAGVECVQVIGAEEMFLASVEAFQACDAAIMTAAVCDYRPSRTLPHKLRKQARDRRITLKPTKDICAYLGRTKQHRVVIGFAMEDHDEYAHAEQKLQRKHCDAIVLNGMANVGSDDATVEILTAGGDWSAPFAGSKQLVARHVVALCERLVDRKPATDG